MLFNTVEYPGPALSLASITIIVALLLIATSLLVTVTASLLASFDAIAIRTCERCAGLAPGQTGE